MQTLGLLGGMSWDGSGLRPNAGSRPGSISRASQTVAAMAIAMAMVATSILVTGCSVLPMPSAEDRRYLAASEGLIEGDLADQIGLGVLSADCEGRNLGPGDGFGCAATVTAAPERAPIEFVATVSDDGEGVDLAATNLLLAEQVERIESHAAALIAQDTLLPIGEQHFECADNSLVMAPGGRIDCLVTDPTDESIHAVTITVDDIETLSFVVDVGDRIG